MITDDAKGSVGSDISVDIKCDVSADVSDDVEIEWKGDVPQTASAANPEQIEWKTNEENPPLCRSAPVTRKVLVVCFS